MKRIVASLLWLCALCGAWAQNMETQVAPLPTEKPKIMVIPYTAEGEDIRTVLENDVNKRIALTKIKEAFDQRGYTTVDFFAKVKALSKATALGKHAAARPEDNDCATVGGGRVCGSGD